MKKILIVICLISTALYGRAQHSAPSNSLASLSEYQDSLKHIGFRLVNAPSETERYNASYNLIKTLSAALKIHNSFNFPFDSLKTISLCTSPDRRLRVFTWHVMNNDGSYRYYGTVQMNTGAQRLEMYPLIDHSFEIKNPQDRLLNNKTWYGCQYYKIIPITYNSPNPFYILLGWKGNNPESTKKVIEVMQIKDGQAIFGRQIFDGDTEAKNAYRRVFEYSRQASMLLNYLPAINTIVFDHLAAADSNHISDRRLYGPDLTYDGFHIEKGRLKFKRDLDLKNAPMEHDKSYLDPKDRQRPGINKVQR